jgi:histidyl-tRNA synthetase
MTQSSAPPSGTRDFTPDEARKRLALVDKIRSGFELHGFLPIETPAFERLELLMGKYGPEGEKLIFKILKRGELGQQGESDYALRYDLTVPLSRFFIEHRNELVLPFRRYHIGPVWRADRPGKGRFREFLQCDADILGSTSPACEVEVVHTLAYGLASVGLRDFTIRVNSRPLLQLMMQAYGIEESKITSSITTIDKFDKIGAEGVHAELLQREISAASAQSIRDDLSNADSAAAVRTRVIGFSPAGADILRAIDNLIAAVTPNIAGVIKFDPWVARGLDYYTGIIFEIAMGAGGPSIASGGRYDQLIFDAGGTPVPACGGSIGLERLIALYSTTVALEKEFRVLITVWDESSTGWAFSTSTKLRAAGICCEVYVGTGNLRKQLSYASSRSFDAVVICGPSEAEAGSAQVKQLGSGVQTQLPTGQLCDFLLQLQALQA